MTRDCLEEQPGLSLFGVELGMLFMDVLESVHAKAKKAAFPLIFLLYNLHVVPKCLILPTKCYKNLSFDITDGKDLLAHEAHSASGEEQCIKYHPPHP